MGRALSIRGKFRVGGDPHYRLDFDDPIRLQDLGKDLAAAPPDGIQFVGNRHENTFNGDIGKDKLSGGGGDDASVASVATMSSTAAVERTSCRVEMATIA